MMQTKMLRHHTAVCLRALMLILSFSLVSCGYHIGISKNLSSYRTISTAYIEEDPNGLFTAELIRQINVQGVLQYTPTGGDLLLQVQAHEPYSHAIGFRYDRDYNGKRENEINPTESRLKQKVFVSLLDTTKGKYILNSVCIDAAVEFDYQASIDSGPLLQSTLGQIDQNRAAVESAHSLLHQKLAQAIVHFVYNNS